MRAANYARVSTTDQNCELQLSQLRAYLVNRGWEAAGEYVSAKRLKRIVSATPAAGQLR